MTINRSLISITDLTKEEILFLIKFAEQIQKNPQKFSTKAKGKILSLLFFEPSTRTYFSFQSAMQRLGGTVIGFTQSTATSAAKGEILEDTARMMSAYSDVMVMRHAKVGALQHIHNIINIPLISGGEGSGEHPTQTLTDLFTIYKYFKELKNITIAIYGDLKYGRTAHSLLLAAAQFGAKFIFIAPDELQMPQNYIAEVEKNNSQIKFGKKLDDFVQEIDVLYVTRLQKERLPKSWDAEKNYPSINLALVNQLKKSAVIMHPLPRVDGIDQEVDQDARAKYFEQAANAVSMRMAILLFYLNGQHNKISPQKKKRKTILRRADKR